MPTKKTTPQTGNFIPAPTPEPTPPPLIPPIPDLDNPVRLAVREAEYINGRWSSVSSGNMYAEAARILRTPFPQNAKPSDCIVRLWSNGSLEYRMRLVPAPEHNTTFVCSWAIVDFGGECDIAFPQTGASEADAMLRSLCAAAEFLRR